MNTDDKCGVNTGKLVWNWCEEYGAIEILSTKSMGGDWAWGNKTYHNIVLAELDTTISKNKIDWRTVILSSDSVFYFNYVIKWIFRLT